MRVGAAAGDEVIKDRLAGARNYHVSTESTGARDSTVTNPGLDTLQLGMLDLRRIYRA